MLPLLLAFLGICSAPSEAQKHSPSEAYIWHSWVFVALHQKHRSTPHQDHTSGILGYLQRSIRSTEALPIRSILLAFLGICSAPSEAQKHSPSEAHQRTHAVRMAREGGEAPPLHPESTQRKGEDRTRAVRMTWEGREPLPLHPESTQRKGEEPPLLQPGSTQRKGEECTHAVRMTKESGQPPPPTPRKRVKSRRYYNQEVLRERVKSRHHFNQEVLRGRVKSTITTTITKPHNAVR